MSTFPTPKVHRVPRNKLGRNQHIQVMAVTAVVTTLGAVATITFNTPVVVTGSLDIHPVGLTLVSQIQLTPTVFALTYGGDVSVVEYSGIPPGYPKVVSAKGGYFAGIAPFTFSPPDPAVVFAWYAADLIIGLSDSDPVSTWADLSTQGNDLSASGGARPTYRLNQLNALPGVDFAPNNVMACSPLAAPFALPYTVACVCEVSDIAGNSYLFITNDVGHGAIKPQSSFWQLISGGGQAGAVAASTSPTVLGTFFASGSERLVVNNGTTSAGSLVNSAGDVVRVGATGTPNLFLTGKVYELIVAPGDVVTALSGYLLNKWIP